MPYLTYSRALQLKKELHETDAEVITPDDEHYVEGITRFSESSEREAVSTYALPTVYSTPCSHHVRVL